MAVPMTSGTDPALATDDGLDRPSVLKGIVGWKSVFFGVLLCVVVVVVLLLLLLLLTVVVV